MLKNNTKEIISLVKNDFIPLEESKEGFLKGGFGSIIQMGIASVGASNNCMCGGNNCKWCNDGKDNCPCPNMGCDIPRGGNNCNCGTTTVPPTPPPPANSPFNSLTDGGMFF